MWDWLCRIAHEAHAFKQGGTCQQHMRIRSRRSLALHLLILQLLGLKGHVTDACKHSVALTWQLRATLFRSFQWSFRRFAAR